MRVVALLNVLSFALPILANRHGACTDGFFPGTDTVIYTVPYNYSQVLPIIDDFGNLTWFGVSPSTVNLTGPDNTVGTSRSYELKGAHPVETLTKLSISEKGPYVEIHYTNTITVAGVSLYSDYDATFAHSVCQGKATTFNFTIDFCATNTTVAAAAVHTEHMAQAINVGTFLGGMNFTDCKALNATNTTLSSHHPFHGPQSSIVASARLPTGTRNAHPAPKNSHLSKARDASQR